MSWDLQTLADALAAALEPIAATVYDEPPTSLNPPALVVSFPELVELEGAALGLDVVTIPVVAVVNWAESAAAMGELIKFARTALEVDPRLGGAVAFARLGQVRAIRAEKVSGIDVLTADLVLTVQM